VLNQFGEEGGGMEIAEASFRQENGRGSRGDCRELRSQYSIGYYPNRR
jgi:hypothetical protein